MTTVGEESAPVAGPAARTRRSTRWVLALVLLAGLALAGAFATERYQDQQISHLVAARGQVERFGDHDTYLLVWNDEIFANLVPVPENWLAQLPEGARVRLYYSPVTQQIVLRSRRYDAPQLCLALAGSLLVAALVVRRRSRRATVPPSANP